MKRIKQFFGDFKKFITKGNIVDLAVAVVVGTAFNKIVTSLVNDIIMPLITWALGANSIADLSLVLKEDAEGVATLTWNYGNFLQTIIDFLIISFCIFVVLKILMEAQKLYKEVGERVKNLTAKEIKKLKKKGLSNEEIEQISVAKAEAVAEPVVEEKPTTEELLADILEVLRKQEKEPKNNEKNEQVSV